MCCKVNIVKDPERSFPPRQVMPGPDSALTSEKSAAKLTWTATSQNPPVSFFCNLEVRQPECVGEREREVGERVNLPSFPPRALIASYSPPALQACGPLWPSCSWPCSPGPSAAALTPASRSRGEWVPLALKRTSRSSCRVLKPTTVAPPPCLCSGLEGGAVRCRQGEKRATRRLSPAAAQIQLQPSAFDPVSRPDRELVPTSSFTSGSRPSL